VKVCIHQIELPTSIHFTVLWHASNLGRPFCELERCGKVFKDFRYFILLRSAHETSNMAGQVAYWPTGNIILALKLLVVVGSAKETSKVAGNDAREV
jgi:hypothetical protein